MMLQRPWRSRGIAVLVLAAALLSAAPFARGDDARLTIADVERVTGIKGLQILAPAAVPGAGPGLNFAGPDKTMALMVNFGTADLYLSTCFTRRGKTTILTLEQLKQLAAIVASRL